MALIINVCYIKKKNKLSTGPLNSYLAKIIKI